MHTLSPAYRFPAQEEGLATGCTKDATRKEGRRGRQGARGACPSAIFDSLCRLWLGGTHWARSLTHSPLTTHCVRLTHPCTVHLARHCCLLPTSHLIHRHCRFFPRHHHHRPAHNSYQATHHPTPQHLPLTLATHSPPPTTHYQPPREASRNNYKLYSGPFRPAHTCWPDRHLLRPHNQINQSTPAHPSIRRR